MQVLVKRASCVWVALWIGLVLSTVTSPSALAQSTLTPAAKEALQEGIAAAKFQNWDAAQKYFDDAFRASGGAPEVLFNLGLLNELKGGAELVASAWYRAYLAAVPTALNRAQIEARLIELHASAEARAAKYLATAKEAAKQLVPTVSPSVGELKFDQYGEGIVDADCNSGFSALLSSEVSSDHLEGVDEVIDWFQGNECQNYLLYSVVEALFTFERSQEAPRYIEQISGPWKVNALALFASVNMPSKVHRSRFLDFLAKKQDEQATAIKLVEEAEAVATQLLKQLGKSTFSDKHNALRLRSEMAMAWCLVGNAAKALRTLERIDPNALFDSPLSQSGWSLDSFEHRVKAVVATLLLLGKDKEAKAAMRAIVSKIEKRFDWTRENLQQDFKRELDDLTRKSHEDLITETNKELSIYYGLALQGWPENEFSVKSALESSQSEQDYWIRMAKGLWGLEGDVYRDDGKFLAEASGSDAGDAVGILSKGAADLLRGSRWIREIAAAWRKDGADQAQ